MWYKKFFCLIMMGFVSLSFGCMASAPPEESVADVSTVATTRAPAMATAVPTLQTPTAIPSLTPLPTIQPTATETPYVIPTPPGNEVREQALWLLETNNGCLLPCWWGITPSETTWDTAYELIRIFDRVPHRVTVNSEYTFYEPVVPLPSGVFEYDEAAHFYSVRNGIVERIEMPVSRGDLPDGYLTQYTLPMLLTNYGPPAEVWLSTYRAAYENDDLPFFAVLFYPEQGIVASYSDNGVRQGDFVQGCPQENPVSYLVLMSPGTNQTLKQVVGGSSAFNRDFLPLGESTEMDVATFYETFKNPDNTTCLETPADLWH